MVDEATSYLAPARIMYEPRRNRNAWLGRVSVTTYSSAPTNQHSSLDRSANSVALTSGTLVSDFEFYLCVMPVQNALESAPVNSR
jgi:hypothetical protein